MCEQNSISCMPFTWTRDRLDMVHPAYFVFVHYHKQNTHNRTNTMASQPRTDVEHLIARAVDDNSSQSGRSEGSLQTSVVVGGLRRVPRVSDDGGLELLRAQRRIRELMQAAMGRKSLSKNKTRRCLKNLPHTDRTNVITVYSFIDDKLWSQHHIRRPKWPGYSTKPKTMCQRILRCGINIPAGTTEEDYWTTMLVTAVNNKYTFGKSNVFEKTKVQHKGKIQSATC